MNADRLLALYEKVAEAPDAIARLRRFVLDLAVRGKLVERDARDEPASELLKRIASETARLVKAGSLGRTKAAAPTAVLRLRKVWPCSVVARCFWAFLLSRS